MDLWFVTMRFMTNVFSLSFRLAAVVLDEHKVFDNSFYKQLPGFILCLLTRLLLRIIS